MNLFKVFFLSSLAYANNVFAVSFPETQEVYKTLRAVNHLPNYKLILVTDQEVNAWSGGGRIYITTSMLKYLKNKNEVALVLAHETGHLLLHHGYSNWPHEYAADALGSILAVNAGYNKCNGMQALKRLHDKGSKTHPPTNDRVKRVGC